jgi:hypothetical protein
MTSSPREQGCPAGPAGHPARPLSAAALAGLAALAVLAACAGHFPGGATDPPTGPSTVVLRVLEEPGFGSPTTAAPLPEFSLYGDGTVIAANGTRGALRTARWYRLTRTAYQRLYRAALAAGLDRDRHLDTPPAPDAAVLTFQLRAGGATHTTRVLAPTLDDADRRALATFRRTLRPGSWPAADLAAQPTDYRPTRLAAIATWSATGDTPEARPWPLGDPATGAKLDGGLCTVHHGTDLTTATRLAAAATPNTLWAAAGNTYHLAFRPLLPDETGCAALSR